MKKVTSLVLILALCLSLCSCSSIESIDTSSIVSRVENIVSTVTEKRHPEKAFIGEWVCELNEIVPKMYLDGYYTDTLMLNEDMTYTHGSKKGTWFISEDFRILNLYEHTGYAHSIPIVEEDGYKKLNMNYSLYVLADERQEILDKKYVSIQLNSIEYGNYLGEMQFVGHPPKNWSSTPSSFYLLEDLLCKEGLIYIGCSNNFRLELVAENGKHPSRITLTSPFEFIPTARTNGEALNYTVERLIGKIYYVSPEYVDRVYFDQDNMRTIKMKTGYEIYDHANTFWDLIPDVNPMDFN